MAVFGDLAAILKIKQKFLFSRIDNIHLSLTMQKEILESLLWRLQITDIDRFQNDRIRPLPYIVIELLNILMENLSYISE